MGKQLNKDEDIQLLADFAASVFAGKGWAILSFDLGPGGIGNWLSNVERPDMVKALREMANHLENGTIYPRPKEN